MILLIGVTNNRKEFQDKVKAAVIEAVGDREDIRVYYDAEMLPIPSWSPKNSSNCKTYITVHVGEDTYFQELDMKFDLKNLPTELNLEMGSFYRADSNRESYRTRFVPDSAQDDNSKWYRTQPKEPYYKWCR
jgi:hypothetical protein